MKKFLFALTGILCALCVNGAIGAAVGGFIGIEPLYGALAGGGISIAASLAGGFIPAGSLVAGVYVEAWTGQMIKAFRQDPEGLGWYSKIRSYDQYANNDVIHFVHIGGDPTVLVNNTTYPLEIQTLEDGDKAVSLDKFQSQPTRITDDELYALSFDKKASVIERHQEAMKEKLYSRALHSISAAENTKDTPVIATTGAAVDGRKTLTRSDIIKLKKLFDRNNVPKLGRVLVLCADHIADLLDVDQKFAGQYYNYTDGKVAKLFGFEIYEFNDCPYYNATTLRKLAYGAVPTDTDTQASIAFSPQRMMKANGSVKAYAAESKDRPETQDNLISFRAYSVCLPLKEEAMGAIVSARA